MRVCGSPSARAGRREHARALEAACAQAPRAAVPEPWCGSGVTVMGLWVGFAGAGPGSGQRWLGCSGARELWGRVRGWRLELAWCSWEGVRPVDVAVPPARSLRLELSGSSQAGLGCR